MWGDNANLILPGLWLGNIASSRSRQFLTSKKITHILTVASGIEPAWPEEYKYLILKGLDEYNVNLLQHFPLCNKFIEEGRQQGGILVHCMAGVSRSATIVAQYIMQLEKADAWDTIDKIRLSRPEIYPNQGFVEQLKYWEKMNFEIDTKCELYANAKQNFPVSVTVESWCRGKMDVCYNVRELDDVDS